MENKLLILLCILVFGYMTINLDKTIKKENQMNIEKMNLLKNQDSINKIVDVEEILNKEKNFSITEIKNDKSVKELTIETKDDTEESLSKIIDIIKKNKNMYINEMKYTKEENNTKIKISY